MPRSVAESWGPVFLRDLSNKVEALYSDAPKYEPQLVIYDDSGGRSFHEQGNALLQSAQSQCITPGFAVAMVHEPQDRHARQHDQLAAFAIRKLRELDIYAAVMHTEMGNHCYDIAIGNGTKREYRVTQNPKWRGRLSGYVTNVALNKVLLTNEKWPSSSALATPLHADVVVGVDVKANTAGFTVIGRDGSKPFTKCATSRQKERLMPGTVSKVLVDVMEFTFL